MPDVFPPKGKNPLFDDEPPAAGDNTYRVTQSELLNFVERIERLDADKQDLADLQKEVRAEAKARGYDTRTLNEMIRLRKLDADERNEREALRTLYGDALGVFS